jgi:DNA repair exonuclease SbcCD ATPase subunit
LAGGQQLINTASIDQSFEQLRQALARLLQADFTPLQSDIQTLQKQLHQLETMSSQMSGDQGTLRTALRELVEITDQIDQRILQIQTDLSDRKKVAERLKPVLGPPFRKNVQQAPDLYTDPITPVITPAIREQIRNNRTEMIAALYPIIGQTIGKAIFEAFQDLRRSIDARLKQNLDLRQRFFHLVARGRGVSVSDLLLRESLPYAIKHVFLIHRQTGLLLK